VIVQVGPDDNSPYGNWGKYPGVFISRPYFKIVLDSGLGFYILNSHKYFLFPKFYGAFNSSFWEFGFKFACWTFEVMWNKSFKV